MEMTRERGESFGDVMKREGERGEGGEEDRQTSKEIQFYHSLPFHRNRVFVMVESQLAQEGLREP
eukprot:1001038-Amorphochlora_amoeboformis.AAC.1